MNDQRVTVEAHVAQLVADATAKLTADRTPAADMPTRLAQAVPLVTIVRNADPTLKAYEAADDQAMVHQARFHGIIRNARWAALLGALISAIALLPAWITSWVPPSVISYAQIGMLALTLLILRWSRWGGYAKAWMQTRSVAEGKRNAFFADVVRAPVPPGADAATATRQKYNLLMATHLIYQRDFLVRRAAKHRVANGAWTRPRLIGYLLCAAIVVLALPLVKLVLGWVGLQFGWLTAAASMLDGKDFEGWRLAATAAALSVFAFADARTTIDQDERKATLYEATATKLASLLDGNKTLLERCDGGDEKALKLLFREARLILEAEHFAWITSPLAEELAAVGAEHPDLKP
jgi:hypothetical protein